MDASIIMDVTLVTESLDPSMGGIPRYSFEVSKIKEIKNVINFSEKLRNKTLIDKILNKSYRRKKLLESRRGELGELVHFTQPEIMFKTKSLEGRKIVLTVHDLAVFGTMKVGGVYGAARGAAFRKQFRFAIDRADYILANSTQTMDELKEKLGVDNKKIGVSTLGVEEKFKPLKEVKVGEDIGYFGGFDRRKRVDKLIEDFIASTISSKLHLVVYGGTGDYLALKKKYEKFGEVLFKDKIPEGDLVKTINSFRYFVYPTSYEGFGLPLLETVACGVPSFVYKDATIPKEVKKYAREIENLDEIDKLDYKELRKEYSDKSEKVKKEFSWDGNRAAVVDIYRTLLGTADSVK